MDVTEIECYKNTLKDLDEFAKNEDLITDSLSIPKLTAKLIAADYDTTPENRGFFLILEDISNNHSLKDFNAGLSEDEIRICLERIAWFHAVAFCFKQKKDINFNEKYPFLSCFKVE